MTICNCLNGDVGGDSSSPTNSILADPCTHPRPGADLIRHTTRSHQANTRARAS